MPNFHNFLADLASAKPVPGGGSVAAYQVAMSAALLAMVCSLTLGRKRYYDVAEQVGALKDQALLLLQRAQELAEQDSEAYNRVASAMALPRVTDAEKSLRRERVQAALKGAAHPPLLTMQAATDALQLAEQLVSIGNSSAVSDVGTAALAARAGFYGARLNVRINMASVRDEAWVRDMETSLQTIPLPDEREAAIMRATERTIRGSAE